MQPRGQLWFELQRVCQDFRAYSGLGEREGLELLVTVLRNLLAEQQAELEKLAPPEGTDASGPVPAREGERQQPGS